MSCLRLEFRGEIHSGDLILGAISIWTILSRGRVEREKEREKKERQGEGKGEKTCLLLIATALSTFRTYQAP